MIKREDWAKKLEEIRKEEYLSIQDFAQDHVGVAFLTYKRVLADDTSLSYGTLRKIEEYLEGKDE